MIGSGTILWYVNTGKNDTPYLVLRVHTSSSSDPTYSGQLDFLCLETGEQFQITQSTIGKLVRDQLVYFTGHV